MGRGWGGYADPQSVHTHDGALSDLAVQGGAVFRTVAWDFRTVAWASHGPQRENGLRRGNHKMQCGGMKTPPTERGPSPGQITEIPAQADLGPTFVAPIPLQDHVLVQRHAAVAKIGEILLPGTARSKPKKGTILSVGPGRLLDNGKRAEMELQPGDVVYFSPYAGLNLEEIAREDGFLVMVQEDVLCRDPRPGEQHLTAQRRA